MTKRRTQNADPFDVYGWPPQIVLDQLGKKDHDRLRRYICRVVNKVYGVAYNARQHVHGEQGSEKK